MAKKRSYQKCHKTTKSYEEVQPPKGTGSTQRLTMKQQFWELDSDSWLATLKRERGKGIQQRAGISGKVFMDRIKRSR